MPVAPFLALALAVQIPAIMVEQTATGYVARVTPFDLRRGADVDAEIERRAAQLCGVKNIRWGEFRSVTKLGKNPTAEPAPVTGYAKEFSCVAPQVMSYARVPEDWTASSADVNDALRFFEKYYARRDHGDFAGAFTMFSPGTVSDFPSWSKNTASDNKKLGAGTRRVTGVTWDLNPSDAPHPGAYVSIDFVGDFPSTYFYCGYLALYRRGPGAYEVVHEEQNMFAHGDNKADPAQVAQMRADMCRE